MAMNTRSEAMSFSTSQWLQFIALIAAGLLAWGNLKGDIREGFAQVRGRMDVLERRVLTLEREDTAPVRQGR
jgi:hypothetical protein